jgi:hypothetical protein
MIQIFHGDDLALSREAYLKSFSTIPANQIFHTDSKNIDLNQINNFLHGGSLFSESLAIAIDNFYSISKPIQTKIILFLLETKAEVYLWQDKMLTVAQLKLLPSAKVNRFKADNHIFPCLNSIRPKNIQKFIPLYKQVCGLDLFDLFFYLLKASFRKQLQTKSVYSSSIMVKSYLHLIELEYQYKTGQLTLSKEIALERILLPLVK